MIAATVSAKLLTTKEAAALLGISVHTLKRARTDYNFGTRGERNKILPKARYMNEQPYYELQAVLKCLEQRAKHRTLAVKRSVLRSSGAWEISE